jgi:serine/threonine protein kinase/WD40 repeat protein
MPDESVLLGELAEEFAARVRAGQMPAVEEYAERHPALADRIRALFPTLMLLEGLAAGGPAATTGAGAALGSGAAFGGYRIEAVLGRGGMGVVYEAVHLALGRRVALKVLPVAGPRPAAQLERFLREAQTAAGLHHTNIVPVFDVGQAGGTPYYAMQLIRGTPLDRAAAPAAAAQPDAATISADTLPAPGPAPTSPTDRPAPGPGHYRWVAEVGVQAAEALAYAHARGVIHRDVKPSNLIQDERGVVWVTDFGLARRLEDVALTHTGAILGTPRYMSPEQAEAAKRPVDHRTDVYSLGATLYELLTRRPAFDGKTPHEVVLQVIEREPVPPRRLDPKVPADLETVVLKAMAKKPADRYATAQALADDLQRYLRLEPIQARRIGPVGRLARWSRRHPTAAALVAVCLLSGLGLLALGLGMWHNAEQRALAVQDLETAKGDLETIRVQAQEADAHVKQADELAKLREQDVQKLEAKIKAEQEGLDRVKEHAQDTEARLAYEQARTLQTSAELDRRPRILALVKKAEALRRRPHRFPPATGEGALALPAQSELRTEAAAALLLAEIRPVREVKLPEGFGLAITPDGRLGAAIHWDTDLKNFALRIIDLEDGKERAVLTAKRNALLRSALSPDGKQVAVSSVEPNVPLQIQTWEASQDKLVRTLDLPKEVAAGASVQGHHPVYSPDGHFLAATLIGKDRHHSVLWDLHDGTARIVDSCAVGKEPVFPWAVFSRDGKRLAVPTGAAKVTVRDVAAGGQPAEIDLPLPLSAGMHPAFGHGLLVLGCQAKDGSQKILVWDTRTNQEKFRLASGAEPFSLALALSPDEQLLAASDGWGGIALFDLAAGKRILRVKSQQGDEFTVLAWKPDSRQLITAGADQRFRVWEVVRDQPHSTLLTDLGPGAAIAFSPDGDWLAVADPGRTRLLHRAGKVAPRDLAGVGADGAAHLVFRADSRQLAAWDSKRVAAWDVPSGQPIAAAAPKEMVVAALAFGRDGALWAAGYKDAPRANGAGWTGVWDLTADRELFDLSAARGPLFYQLSFDGRMLISASYGNFDLWEMPAGRRVRSFLLEGGGQVAQAVGDNPRWLAIVHFTFDLPARFGVTVVEASTGTIHLDIDSPNDILARPAISTDGRLLAIAFRDGSVQVWDIAAKQELFRWTAPPDHAIQALAFTPEGGLAMSDGSSLQLLDLPRLNRQLVEIDLGW